MYNFSNLNTCDNSCDNGRFPDETPLAMCYVPMQKLNELYPENTAFEKGTIFPDLDFPFKAAKGDMNNG